MMNSDGDVEESIIATTIYVSRSMLNHNITSGSSSSFAFVCKYHMTSNDTWTMDNRVCRTVIPSSSDSSSVTCMCNQPVTHAVSLDYIQSAIGEEANGRANSDDSPCTNPCGCTLRQAPKLQPWAKALIGISVSVVIVAIAVLSVIIVLIVVKKVLMKRSGTIETKIELRNALDSPTMFLRFCWWWLMN